ncbi:unnamed protein product [Parnassius mnemosyne]|uniref:Uncharacterized protein n=1 Tax=Parnassius mnemosyne TaxID=213953 RepID=A0AAV1L1P8_9NEOP
MSDSHRLKPHGVPPSPHIGRATGTLSHTSAAMAVPPRERTAPPPSPSQVRRTRTHCAPSSSASNFTCATDAPVSDVRRPWGQEKLALRSTSLPDPSGGSGLWLRRQPRFGCGG